MGHTAASSEVDGRHMKHHLIKKSFVLSGHSTSIALEKEFWSVLQNMATAQNLSLAALITRIDQTRIPEHPLASALRVTALKNAYDISDSSCV